MTAREREQVRRALKLLMADDGFTEAIALLSHLGHVSYPAYDVLKKTRAVSIATIVKGALRVLWRFESGTWTSHAYRRTGKAKGLATYQSLCKESKVSGIVGGGTFRPELAYRCAPCNTEERKLLGLDASAPASRNADLGMERHQRSLDSFR